MVQIVAAPSGGRLEDTDRRDVLTGGIGNDEFAVSRDGRTDTILNFEDGVDQIDLSDFNVTWGEVEVKYKGGNDFVITIRGERTKITFEDPSSGTIDGSFLTADDFIFAEGAAPPAPNVVLDAIGPTLLLGTDQPDVFTLFQDNTRDVIKQFDPTKDKIDLSNFELTYGELSFVDVKPGKVVIQLGTEGLVIRDTSLNITSADLTEDMFIFA